MIHTFHSPQEATEKKITQKQKLWLEEIFLLMGKKQTFPTILLHFPAADFWSLIFAMIITKHTLWPRVHFVLMCHVEGSITGHCRALISCRERWRPAPASSPSGYVCGLTQPLLPHSPSACITTAAPSPPYDITCLESFRDSMVLGWKQPDNSGGAEITGYYVNYREVTDGKPGPWREANIKAVSEEAYKVSGAATGRWSCR